MERDIPECDPRNMSRSELQQWADMGDQACKNELVGREEAEYEMNMDYSREALAGAI